MTYKLNELPPKLRQRVLDSLAAADGLKGELAAKCPSPSKKRIRQQSKPLMNKLEQEAFFKINSEHPDWTIRHHCLTFTLANGVRYTPDICGIDPNGRVHCWEVKGPKIWDDAVVKIKVAASHWNEISWTLIWKEGGRWSGQPILS